MSNKLSSIVEYLAYLVKKYGEIQATQLKNAFRVASIKQTGTETRVIFQVIGKSTFMECSSSEILSNEPFIERFSKKDIQKITYAHAQSENKSIPKKEIDQKLKLIQQEFSIENHKTKFLLKDPNGSTTSKTAEEIAIDKTIINKLSQQDAINIGYIAGYEHSQNTTIKESE